ncbi:hypothetical protein PR048_018462 [Dryococelus australis]|uniref:HTH CENPB-type domain-containing protein n=1 Tax=Dryococelus australis TaxID=614101 RepID=A0ABQ9HCI1_9NEOP|nr:hypothetical protein PR048_018462 [Dryococelus australis]
MKCIGEILADLNIEILRTIEGKTRYRAAPEWKGGRNRRSSRKPSRTAASSDTIPPCKNPGATPPGIEPGSPRWEQCTDVMILISGEMKSIQLCIVQVVTDQRSTAANQVMGYEHFNNSKRVWSTRTRDYLTECHRVKRSDRRCSDRRSLDGGSTFGNIKVTTVLHYQGRSKVVRPIYTVEHCSANISLPPRAIQHFHVTSSHHLTKCVPEHVQEATTLILARVAGIWVSGVLATRPGSPIVSFCTRVQNSGLCRDTDPRGYLGACLLHSTVEVSPTVHQSNKARFQIRPVIELARITKIFTPDKSCSRQLLASSGRRKYSLKGSEWFCMFIAVGTWNSVVMVNEKKKRALSTCGQFQAAMVAIVQGMPVRTAAARWNIPRRTLRNHQSSGSTTRKLGRSSYMTPAQETDLCNRIIRLAEVGMPMTGKVIRRSRYTFCEQRNIANPFDKSSGLAGRKWLKRFLKRHPEISQRKAQSMNPGRSANFNKFIVGDYFDKLKAVDLPSPNNKMCMLEKEHGEDVSIVSCGTAL